MFEVLPPPAYETYLELTARAFDENALLSKSREFLGQSGYFDSLRGYFLRDSYQEDSDKNIFRGGWDFGRIEDPEKPWLSGNVAGSIVIEKASDEELISIITAQHFPFRQKVPGLRTGGIANNVTEIVTEEGLKRWLYIDRSNFRGKNLIIGYEGLVAISNEPGGYERRVMVYEGSYQTLCHLPGYPIERI